jgi:hypothetical protein
VEARRVGLLEEGAGEFGTKVVFLPSHADVLFGRGTPTQHHPGNVKLGLLAEQSLLRHNACSFLEKTALAQEIVSNVKSQGGHFLKQVDGIWEEIDDKAARGKVSHTIRNLRIVKQKTDDEQDIKPISEEVIKKRPHDDWL